MSTLSVNLKAKMVTKNKLYDGEFFRKDRRDGNNFIIVCQICSKQLRAAVSSTANIWKHVDRFHSDMKEKMREKTKAKPKHRVSTQPHKKPRVTIISYEKVNFDLSCFDKKILENKTGAITEEELKPPSQAPASKRRKIIEQHNSSAGGGGGSGTSAGKQQRQNVCGPLSIIFEEVQKSEALHTNYCKELTNLYGEVSSLNWFPLHS